MKTKLIVTLAASAIALAPMVNAQTKPAAAAGDPVAGKRSFGMQCRACHQVASGAGSVTGPNLFGLVGSTLR